MTAQVKRTESASEISPGGFAQIRPVDSTGCPI
jgi:hypothetical protein